MRTVQEQLDHYTRLLEDNETFDTLYDQALAIQKQLKEWELNLIQPDQKTFQDVINFNNKLNAELMYLKDFVDAEDPIVTQGAKTRSLDLLAQWEIQEKKLYQIINEAFNSFESNYRSSEAPILKFDLGKDN